MGWHGMAFVDFYHSFFFQIFSTCKSHSSGCISVWGFEKDRGFDIPVVEMFSTERERERERWKKI
jgi:hypothetical protein